VGGAIAWVILYYHCELSGTLFLSILLGSLLRYVSDSDVECATRVGMLNEWNYPFQGEANVASKVQQDVAGSHLAHLLARGASKLLQY
jgi:hypothetical protein